jgi:hypothetical protein
MDESDFAEEVFETKKYSVGTSLTLGGVVLAISCGVALFAGNTTRGVRLILIGMGALVAVIAWRGALVRVRVRHSDVVAEYAVRTRVVRYADIIDMEVKTEQSGPYYRVKYDVIVLHRRRALPVVLGGFDDEIADLVNALQRRWSTWMDHVHPHWRATPPLER